MKFNSMFLRLLLAWFVLGASLAVVQAQSLEVQAMIWDDGSAVMDLYGFEEGETPPPGHTLYLSTGGGESRPMMIPFSSPSFPVSLPRSESVVFYKRPFNPEQADVQPPVAARVRVPPQARNILILLVPQSLATNDFRAAVIDNSARDFPNNTLRIINMSGETLGLLFDEQTAFIQPGTQHSFPIDINKQTASLVVARNVPGRERPQYRSRRLATYDGTRVTCLLAQDPSTGRIRIISIVDSPPPVEPDEA